VSAVLQNCNGRGRMKKIKRKKYFYSAQSMRIKVIESLHFKSVTCLILHVKFIGLLFLRYVYMCVL
jgi:hypothetical protein